MPACSSSRSTPARSESFPSSQQSFEIIQSTAKPGSDPRLTALVEWLESQADIFGLSIETLQPASSDASFRRYFRLEADARTLIVMDAPPPHVEDRKSTRLNSSH